ncbi:hypothetical protein UFOVP29_30 [uncultured Caudovirales phage]|uniref:Lipoprotein n=1 Tax=uncultured Caudovirales phage TaxID=2100421 RepID=A0A6J5KQJ5_9CAUD|nr:hypothetical protein UFOVP29_30 [uncultured Caudovirales phage]
MMKYVAGLLCLGLAACGGTQSLEVDTVAVKLQIIQPEPPAPIKPIPVQFKVVSRSNQAAQVNLLLTDSEAFIALTTKDYENLSLNMADITRYLKQQQAIIEYYKKMTTVEAKPSDESK